MKTLTIKNRLATWLLLPFMLAGNSACNHIYDAINSAQTAKEKATPVEVKDTDPVKPALIQEAKLDLADGTTTYCQGGDPPPLRLSITRKSGKKEEFRGTVISDADTRVFGMFSWQSSGGTIGEGGLMDTTASSPTAAEQDIEVTATLTANPSIVVKLILKPDFKCSRTADLRGAVGAFGASGAIGHSGLGGSKERPTGESGTHGGNGGLGGNGGDALPVEVATTFYTSEKFGKLALVRVMQVGGSKKGYYLLDPETAILTVNASGGAGGPGGFGGDAGSGGNGYSAPNGECCHGNGGDGGNGGDSGNGGNGGNGAAIIVKVDAKAKALKDRIKAVSDAGAGGVVRTAGSSGRGGLGGFDFTQGPKGTNGREGVAGRVSTIAGKPGAAGPAPKFTTEAVTKL